MNPLARRPIRAGLVIGSLLGWALWLQWPAPARAGAAALELADCEQRADASLAATAQAQAASAPSAVTAWLAVLLAAEPAAPEPARVAQAWQASAAALAASPQARQRAAGLLMAQPWPPGPAGRASLPPESLQALVALGVQSGDATALHWALAACAAAREAPVCQGLSARHLVRVAPTNLVSWLRLLAQEPAALDEALHGMARAETVDLGWLRWAATVAAALPDALAPELRLQIVGELVSRDMAGNWPSFDALLRACGEPALADANRRQLCQAIAQSMVGQSRELITQRIGIALGTRLAWPAERLAALRAEGDPPGSPLPLWLAPGLAPQCAVVLQQQWLAGVEQWGELGWLRQQRKPPAGR